MHVPNMHLSDYNFPSVTLKQSVYSLTKNRSFSSGTSGSIMEDLDL